MLPNPVDVQRSSQLQALECARTPDASGHRIDTRHCHRVLDLLTQGHRLKVPGTELFAGAFEMLATGRDDALQEAMKRASSTAASARRPAEPPRSIAEVLKPIQDRGLDFELRVCDEFDFLKSGTYTPWSRGLHLLKSVTRIPTLPHAAGNAKVSDAEEKRRLQRQFEHRLQLQLQARSDDIARRCEALPANGCALVFGPNGGAVAFKDEACRLSTMALRGVIDPALNVPVLTRNDAAMPGPGSATEELHRIMLMQGNQKWAIAVARPLSTERSA